MSGLDYQQRVDRAIRQLASIGIGVGPAEELSGFTRGLDVSAVQEAALSLFRTPSPRPSAGFQDLEAAGGVQLAQACVAQQSVERAVAGAGVANRSAADVLAVVCERSAAEVERTVSHFEDQLTQLRVVGVGAPPELVKAMGDSALRGVCEHLELRNDVLAQVADALVVDCEEAALGAENAPEFGGDSGANLVPVPADSAPEPADAVPEPIDLESAGEMLVGDVVEPSAASEEQSTAQGQAAGAWSPDIWLAESAAEFGEAPGAPQGADLGTSQGADGGDATVMPANVGITVESSFDVDVERSGGMVNRDKYDAIMDEFVARMDAAARTFESEMAEHRDTLTTLLEQQNEGRHGETQNREGLDGGRAAANRAMAPRREGWAAPPNLFD